MLQGVTVRVRFRVRIRVRVSVGSLRAGHVCVRRLVGAGVYK